MQASIRLRLTAWYVAALAVTLVLLGGAAYYFTRAGLYHWLDESLAERAEALSEEVRLVGGHPEVELEEHGHSAYQGVSDGFIIVDASRVVAIARGLEPQPFLADSSVTAALAGTPSSGIVVDRGNRRWKVSTQPLLSGGAVAAVVLVAHDLDELNEVLEHLAGVLLALFPLGLIGAGVGGYLLAGRALSPVARITRSAEAISEHDLSQRLPVESKDELGHLATTFNNLIERLQHAFERQRRFTGDASHELRTPISIIQAISSQKLMTRREPEEYERSLRQIDEAAGYMGRLVNHLLILARADSGRMALESESLDVMQLVQQVAAQVEEASERAVPVYGRGPIAVRGDALRLTELFLNLIENAVKYTPSEGEVDVNVEQNGADVRIAVCDTGVGIAPEHLPHIFERFYRADKARSRAEGGTGLGLAISLWIAEAHGGTLHAASEAGKGTTLTVTLPLEGES